MPHNGVPSAGEKIYINEIMNISGKTAILFNPSAACGRSRDKKAHLVRLLKEAGVSFELLETRSEAHLRKLVKEVAPDFPVLAGAGGDTTIQIMVNEIMATLYRPALAVIGLGSSNDLAREFGVDSMKRACAALREGRQKKIDIGRILTAGGISRYFLGQASLGLGVWVNQYVASLSSRYSFLAKKQFIAGAVAVLTSKTAGKIPLSLTVEWGNAGFKGTWSVIVFSNIKYWASGRLFNPSASIDDGKLECFLIDDCSLIDLARLYLRTGKGKHTNNPRVRFVSSDSFNISSSSPFSIQADGEIVSVKTASQGNFQARIEICPQTLNMTYYK